MLSVHDLARELRARLPQAGAVKIHKLIYYCQGWNLAWTDRPLFSEGVEAWADGPVVADLWHDEKRHRSRPPAESPDDEQFAVIEYVVERYGRDTGLELVRKTHLEDPWRDVSESDDSFTASNPEITQDALRAWFRRDDEFLAHQTAVAALRERRDIYGFDGPAIPDDLREATLRMLEGQEPEPTLR